VVWYPYAGWGILLTAATYRDTEIRFAQRELTTYVYWTVHHLDSWIKIDQLMSLALFFAQHVSNVSTSSGACDCVWVYRSGSMCVGVTVWFGWGGVVSLCRLRHCLSLHNDTTPPQPNHTVTPTYIEPERYTHTQSQAPEDVCTSIRNMLSKK